MTSPKHTITFVHAPDIRYDQNYGTYFIPLWAYTLASHVPDTWEVVVHDCKVDTLDAIQPSDVFAFSGINQDIDSIRRVHDQIKAKCPKAVFLLGGPITWSLQQEGKLHFLDYFDYLFILDGEETLPMFLKAFEEQRHGQLPRLIEADRFPVGKARKIRFDLLRPKASHYYGAVIEVSRGCPFLCEFCDIRVLPGNNRSNTKSPTLIVEELDEFHRLGVTQIQFACDNFIGNVAEARECVDAVLAWKERTGAQVSIFTWLTINLYKMPDLMAKMRQAGFSILFIGIESVNQHSLLETAKVQNIKSLREAVETIQSHGFIIAPGFIFGFDSDTNTIFDDTLTFIREVGLLGGDPSFLTALSGTPLYKRMQQTGRLVERQDDVTARAKIATNIRYLQDTEFLKNGFLRFMHIYTSPAFQYARFKRHMELLLHSEQFVESDGVGYGSPIEYLKLQFRDSMNRRMLFLRLAYLMRKPSTFWAVLKAWILLKRFSRQYRGLNIHFNYWVYVWTNIGLKYWGLTKADFSIHTVGPDFDLAALLDGLSSDTKQDKETLLRGDEKADTQARYTNQALKRLVEEKQNTTKTSS